MPIRLDTFKNFLPVMQHGRRRVQRQRAVCTHLRIVPTLRFVPLDGHHMVGEIFAKPQLTRKDIRALRIATGVIGQGDAVGQRCSCGGVHAGILRKHAAHYAAS